MPKLAKRHYLLGSHLLSLSSNHYFQFAMKYVTLRFTKKREVSRTRNLWVLLMSQRQSKSSNWINQDFKILQIDAEIAPEAGLSKIYFDQKLTKIRINVNVNLNCRLGRICQQPILWHRSWSNESCKVLVPTSANILIALKSSGWRN